MFNSAPSFCRELKPCEATLTNALAKLQQNITPDELIEFFDFLTGPGSSTLKELVELAGIEKIRFSYRPWVTSTRIKRRTLILPYPNLTAPLFASADETKSRMNRRLARTYLSIFEVLRLRALQKQISPFRTSLPDYQKRSAEILAKSEFQAYDILFYLDPELLVANADERSERDISFGDRRRLTRGLLPSFVQPSVDRALNGWINSDAANPDAAALALGQNVSRSNLNYLWFGDAENRVKKTLWRGLFYSAVVANLFSLATIGPDIYLAWKYKSNIASMVSQTHLYHLTPADLEDGKRTMHEFYRKKLKETQAVLDLHPNADAALSDLNYYQRRFKETE